MSTLAVVLNLVRVRELFENLLKVMNLSPRKLSASQSVGQCLRGLLTLRLDQTSADLSSWRRAWGSGLSCGGRLPQERT